MRPPRAHPWKAAVSPRPGSHSDELAPKARTPCRVTLLSVSGAERQPPARCAPRAGWAPPSGERAAEGKEMLRTLRKQR